jgi:hypothetical protein
MLAVTLHLRGQELSLRDIATRLVITTGKETAGQTHIRWILRPDYWHPPP